jgi:NAD-dependent dihydropyrimidine dehydrogenase PreA subunit
MESPPDYGDWPVPVIDLEQCDGCGLCVEACPTRTLSLRNNMAVVSRPEACEYTGLCEMICPRRAIERPFQIVPAVGELSKALESEKGE